MKTKTKNKLSHTTVHRLNVIMRNMLKYPEQVKMEWWFDTVNAIGKKPPRCGTAGCIGGWAIALFAKRRKMSLKQAYSLSQAFSEHANAGKALGLPRVTQNAYAIDRNRLFCLDRWPKKFSNAYATARTSLGATRAVVNRIKHFIKTDGEE